MKKVSFLSGTSYGTCQSQCAVAHKLSTDSLNAGYREFEQDKTLHRSPPLVYGLEYDRLPCHISDNTIRSLFLARIQVIYRYWIQGFIKAIFFDSRRKRIDREQPRYAAYVGINK